MIHGPYREKGKGIFLMLVIFLSLVAGVAGAWAFSTLSHNREELIANYYDVENAVTVSPHSLRKEIAKGSETYVVVDLRSAEEYNVEHIVGAVNIPAYKDKDTSDYGAVDRIVSSFQELQENYPHRDIVVYCYSKPCMTGRKVGKILADKGIYVKHLGIGWNEWKYQWTTWNHEHEWNITDVRDYIAQGPEAGQFKGTNKTTGCPVEGIVGC